MLEIFKHEQDLSEIILASSTFSIATEAIVATDKEKETLISSFVSGDLVSKAGIEDDDLYYHKAILVTTNWNKNDDIFLPEEVWAAKLSPVHKPTNLNHASSKIVGHITSSWAINDGGEIIGDDTDVSTLPDKFHILTGAVIYKKYHSDPEYQETVRELIEEIEEGKQFVSMECSLRGFDYAIETAEGSIKVVGRNDETSFLTKHLRKYGGSGTYENAKIGRILRDISFIGKAYTPKPANSESVIFRNTDLKSAPISENLEKSSVLSISNLEQKKDDSMSDIFQKQIEDLTSKNDALASEVIALRSELSKADVQKYVAEIDALKASVDELAKDSSKKDEEMKMKDKEAELYKSKAAELEASLKELADEVSRYQAEKLTASRVSVLVDGGYSKEDAEAKVAIFASLNDEQFEVFAGELVDLAMKMKAMKTQEAEVPKKEDPAKSEDSEEVLDEAKSETTELASEVTSEEETEVETVVASLAAKFKAQLTSNKSNGEK